MEAPPPGFCPKPPSGPAGPSNTYIPLEVVGQGSFGVVLHAKVEETGEDVAIKRVLFDRRLHNRELLLMRDVLGDALVPKESEEQGANTTKNSSQTQSPRTPLSSSSLRSPSGSFTVQGRNAAKPKKSPVVLLRKHPNIVQLRSYYFSTEPESGERFLHLVMSYLPTDSQMLKRSYFKKLAEKERARKDNTANGDEESAEEDDPATALFPLLFTKALLFQLCRALAFLHARNVCHRDVKPANILVDPQTGRLQLCDFGSAKQIHNRHAEKNVSYICSRYYRAPELLFGALHYGNEVDMWSAGCIAAEFLRSAGTPLFKGSTTVDQMAEIFKVLGAPSDAEMHAMNPQSALAMRLTHDNQYPKSTTTDSHGGSREPSLTTTGDCCDDAAKCTEEASSACPPLSARTGVTPFSSPTLNSDYYHCYDVLRVEAMQWRRVLHRDVPDEAVDFVSKLLCYIPEKRLTAAAAVEHPFFNDLFSVSSRQAESRAEAMSEGAPACESDEEVFTFPRLPNGKTLPVEMFMLTELETQLYSAEFQQRMSSEVQRISSFAAATGVCSQPNTPKLAKDN